MNKKSMKQKTDHYQGKTPEICRFHQSELQKFTKKKKEEAVLNQIYSTYHDFRPGRNPTFRQRDFSAKELYARILSRLLRDISSATHFSSETKRILPKCKTTLRANAKTHTNTAKKILFLQNPKELFKHPLSKPTIPLK
jgi:hypothetical protein